MEWRPGVKTNLGYYVYLLIDPRNDRIDVSSIGVDGPERGASRLAWP